MVVVPAEDEKALPFEPLHVGRAADDRAWHCGVRRFGGPGADQASA